MHTLGPRKDNMYFASAQGPGVRRTLGPRASENCMYWIMAAPGRSPTVSSTSLECDKGLDHLPSRSIFVTHFPFVSSMI